MMQYINTISENNKVRKFRCEVDHLGTFRLLCKCETTEACLLWIEPDGDYLNVNNPDKFIMDDLGLDLDKRGYVRVV